MRAVFVLLLGACQSPVLPLDAAQELTRVATAPELLGELVYDGTVRPRDSEDPPLFRYERRVVDTLESRQSSHLTFAMDGTPVVLHQAEHSLTYELSSFREIHAQTGLVGDVVVDEDGTATFSTTVDGRTRTRVEPPGDPLHVGPTLFGYVRMNWDSLVAGDLHPVRFVVLDDRRSYRFTLAALDDTSSTFEMKASSPIVRMGVPTMRLVFDTDRTIVSYAGRVPPLDGTGRGLKALDATVTYAHASEAYR